MPKLSGYDFRQLAESPEKQKEVVNLLFTRDDFEGFETPLTRDYSWVADRKRLHRATARFGDGSLRNLGIKEGRLEGPYRESIGIEIAQWFGLPLYEAVGGFDFLAFEALPGTVLRSAAEGAPFAEGIGYNIPYLYALGYSDMKPEHVLLSDAGVNVIDWGTSFEFAPFRCGRMGLVTEVPRYDGAREPYVSGIAAGLRSFLENYNTRRRKSVVWNLLDSLAADARTCDLLINAYSPLPHLRSERAAAGNEKRVLENLARTWDKRHGVENAAERLAENGWK